MRRALIVTCALAVVLSGCARGVDSAAPTSTFTPSETASSPSPKEAAFSDEKACRLLTSKERRSIAGVKLDAVAPAVPAAEHLTVSVAHRPVRSPPRRMNVVTMTAQTWARNFPAQADRRSAAGRAGKKMAKRLQAAKLSVSRGVEKLGNREACQLFSLILETYGAPRNSRTTSVSERGEGSTRGDCSHLLPGRRHERHVCRDRSHADECGLGGPRPRSVAQRSRTSAPSSSS